LVIGNYRTKVRSVGQHYVHLSRRSPTGRLVATDAILRVQFLPRSVFWSAYLSGRSDYADVVLLRINMHAIHNAAEENDVVSLRRFLDADPLLVTNRNELDDEPLHTACMQKHLDSAKLLVEYGANVNSLGDWSRTPLHYAVHDSDRKCIPLVQFLIDSGADPSVVAMGKNVLEYARQEQYEGFEETAAIISDRKA